MGGMYSLQPRGAFGIWRKWKKGPVFPYPIGIRPTIYLHLYYHPYGWYYQRRRTWHGIIWAAHRYGGPPYNPRTPEQQAWRQVFADAVSTWQGMTDEVKDYYNKLKYPRRMSGYNRFIRQYLKDNYPPVVAYYYLLLETGDKILQEDGSGILLE